MALHTALTQDDMNVLSQRITLLSEQVSLIGELLQKELNAQKWIAKINGSNHFYFA